MKHGMGVGVSLLFLVQAIVVAGCGDDGGEPGPGGTGACCTGTQCTIVSSTACNSMDGNYKGNDSTCGTNTCSSGQTGACYGPGNACTMTTRTQCAPPSEYAGDGSMCPPPA
ncbi:MAG: hypothetical protein JNL83_35040 [Myxococcales bacterium]|nr:hypothetical protein [Myxococcales bacterium]